MVYCFSGTGNSQWVADKLNGLLPDEPDVYGLVFPVYGWGMRFYTDKECKELASIDPYHYIRKDKVMLMGGVYVLVHVVK